MSNSDNDKLSGTYKELWITYQNQEMKEIENLTYDELEERIIKWESIEFEARAKRQKDLAEKRTRDLKRNKEIRENLINDPHYSPSDSPSNKSKEFKPYKIKANTGQRLSKEDKLKNSLGDLGIDLGDLLKDLEVKKTKVMVDSMDNKSEE